MTTKTKQILQWILLFSLISIICGYFLQNDEDLAFIKELHARDIVSLIVITISINFIYASKLLLILQKLGLTAITYLQWLNIFIVSRFINLHATQGAVVYRALKLKSLYDFPYTKTVSLNTFFSWFEILTMLVVSLLIIPIFSQHNDLHTQTIVSSLLLLTLGVSLAPFIVVKFKPQHSLKVRGISWALLKLAEICEDVGEVLNDTKLVGKMILYNLATLCLQIFWMHVCLQALSLEITLINLIVFVVTIQLSGVVRIIPGNLGITEIVCGYIAQTQGWNFGAGIIIAAITRLASYLGLAIMGMIFCNPLVSPKNNAAPSKNLKWCE